MLLAEQSSVAGDACRPRVLTTLDPAAGWLWWAGWVMLIHLHRRLTGSLRLWIRCPDLSRRTAKRAATPLCLPAIVLGLKSAVTPHEIVASQPPQSAGCAAGQICCTGSGLGAVGLCLGGDVRA